MSRPVIIRIDTQADLTDLQKTEAAVKKVTGALREAKQEGNLTVTGGGLATNPQTAFGDLPDTKPEVKPLFDVTAVAQRADVEAALKTMQAFRDTLPETSDELGPLNRQIAQLEASLRGAGAQTLREIEALEAMAKATRAAGQDASGLEKKAAALRRSLGEKTPTFADKLKGELGELGRQFPMLGRGMELFERVTSGALGKVTAAVLGVVGAFKLGKRSITEFAEQEQALTKLDAALARSGQLTGEFREKVMGVAIAMEKTTAIARDQWMDALAHMIQMGMPVDEVDRYAEAVKNAAGLMDGNLARAANAVAKAMGGNYDIFREAGIIIDQSIPKHERFIALMQELSVRGGGQLESFGKTLSGSWQRAINATRNFAAAIGGLLEEMLPLRQVLSGITHAIEFWAEKFRVSKDPVEGLENAVKKTVRSLDDGTDSIERQKEALQALNSALEDAKSRYDDVIAVAEKLQSLREAEAKALLDRQIAEVEASDLPEEQKLVAIQRLTRDDQKRQYQEEQRFIEGVIRATQDKLKSNEANLKQLEQMVSKEETRLELESKFNAALQNERSTLNDLENFRTARSVMDGSFNGPSARPFNATVQALIGGEGSDREKVAAIDRMIETRLENLGAARGAKSGIQADVEDKSDIPIDELRKRLEKEREAFQELETQTRNRLAVLAATLESEKRQFKFRQEELGITQQREALDLKKRQDALRGNARIDLLRNQADAQRAKGVVPSAELSQIAAIQAREIKGDASIPADVRAMRVQDIREDTASDVAGAFKSLRGSGMPKFSKAAEAIKEVMTEMNQGTGTLLDVVRQQQAQLRKQAGEIQQLQNQQRYNLNL